MSRNKWIAIGIVAFIILAPVDATNVAHSLVAFFQNLLSGFHLH